MAKATVIYLPCERSRRSVGKRLKIAPSVLHWLQQMCLTYLPDFRASNAEYAPLTGYQIWVIEALCRHRRSDKKLSRKAILKTLSESPETLSKATYFRRLDHAANA